MRALKYLKVKEKYKVKEILNLMKSWNSKSFKRNPNPKNLRERREPLSLKTTSKTKNYELWADNYEWIDSPTL